MREWADQTWFDKRDDPSRGSASGIVCECAFLLIVSGFVPLGCAFGQEVTQESGDAFRLEFEGEAGHGRSPTPLYPASDSPKPAGEVFRIERPTLALSGFDAAGVHAPLLDLRVPEVQQSASPEFRPHGPSLCPKAQPGSTDTALALASDASFWQRMHDFRGRDGLRLLTLWKSSWSTLSLQTGKRGGPSLQWTSRRMNHDGAKSGLFDTLFPVFFGGDGAHAQLFAAHSTHPSERPASERLASERLASERLRDLMPDPLVQPK
jgi:hypothetical protein